MKDFWGTSIRGKNAKLNWQGIVIISNNMDNSNLKELTYTPNNDGIFVIGCAYAQNSYAFIKDSDSPTVRLVSCASGSGTPAPTHGICLAYEGCTYEYSSVRGQWLFVPYQ